MQTVFFWLSWLVAGQTIGDLGNDSFPVREQASCRLAHLGILVRPALEAALSSADPEVRYRARLLYPGTLEPWRTWGRWLWGLSWILPGESAYLPDKVRAAWGRESREVEWAVREVSLPLGWWPELAPCLEEGSTLAASYLEEVRWRARHER